jgi:hypothetical protein
VKPDSKLNMRVLRDGKPRDFTVMARPRPGFMAFEGGFPDLPAMPPLNPFFMVQGPLANMELATFRGIDIVFRQGLEVTARAPVGGKLGCNRTHAGRNRALMVLIVPHCTT